MNNQNNMMAAWAINKYGAISQLIKMQLPIPNPKADEILIRIRAASINPVDFKIRNGSLRFILNYKFPLILGNDCSGVVQSIGSNVTSFKPGDEVYTRPHKDRIGTLAEFICAQESAVALKPKNLSFEEAASIPLVGLTSWQALLTRSHMKSGDRVFIPAGSGGVGTFAIQLAKHFGAYVITNTSTKNVDFVKSLGADEVIDYRKRDFGDILKNIDIVFDTMGGETQNKGFSTLRKGGTLVSIVGPPTAAFVKEVGLPFPVQVIAFFLGLKSVIKAKLRGCSYLFLFMLPDGRNLSQIASIIEDGKIKPVIDSVFSFSQADLALSQVEKGHSRGKVIVSMEPSE